MYYLHSIEKLHKELAKLIWSKCILTKIVRIICCVLEIFFWIVHHIYNKSHRSISLSAYYLPQNAGDIARKFIKDQELLSFIDAEVWEICELIHFSSFPLWSMWSSVNTSLVEGWWLLIVFVVFYCEHSQCLENTHDKCKHGKFNLDLLDLHFNSFGLLLSQCQYNRSCAIGTSGGLIIQLVALVVLQYPWQMALLKRAVKSVTKRM